MRFREVLIICALAALLASPVLADNSVRVESKDVCASAESVTVGIFINNDVEARHIILPIELRVGEGRASVSSLTIGWGGRLPPERNAALGDNVFNHLYKVKDCECRSQMGYGSVVSTEPGPHEIDAMPIGLLLSRLRFVGKNLMPGVDSTEASITLTVDVRSKLGEIIIDTTCICPNHELGFVYGENDVRMVRPDFTRGVITVGACKDESE